MCRQITFYKYECGKQEMRERPDGLFELVKTPVVTVEDSTMTKTMCRKAIMDSGVECKRGDDVYWTKVGRVRYKFTTEALKSIAMESIELPLEDAPADE